MTIIIKPTHPIASTGDLIPPHQVSHDGERIIDCIYGGGVAIVALDVAYAIIGCYESAIRKIFTAKHRRLRSMSPMQLSAAMKVQLERSLPPSTAATKNQVGYSPIPKLATKFISYRMRKDR